MDAIEHGNTAYNVRLPTRGFALEFGGGEGMAYDDHVSKATRARRFHMTAAFETFYAFGTLGCLLHRFIANMLSHRLFGSGSSSSSSSSSSA
jgi:hypothetical protein